MKNPLGKKDNSISTTISISKELQADIKGICEVINKDEFKYRTETVNSYGNKAILEKVKEDKKTLGIDRNE